MNETPIQQYYALPYDRWEGYEAERRRLINYLRKNVKNVVFLTTDTHANLVNEVRLRTLEQGGPINSGMFEFVTGPVATKTFSKEIDDAVGREELAPPSAPRSSSPSRRTGWEWTAPPPTPTATRR